MKLYVITLPKIQLVSGQSRPCQKPNVCIVQEPALGYWALAHGLILLFFRGAICKHQERVKGMQIHLCIFIMNKAKIYFVYVE